MMMVHKNRTAVHLLMSAALLLTLNADSEDGCSAEVKVRRNTKYDVFQGAELRIQCPVSFCSLPPPTVIWKKFEEPQIQISSSRGIKIIWEQNNKFNGASILVFEKIHRNDSGLYRCEINTNVGHCIKVSVHGQNENIKTKTSNQSSTENPEVSTVTTTDGLLTEQACSDVYRQYFYRTLGVLAFVLVLTAVCFTSKRCYKG
ncbi:B- and T-lymphocyte attenuator [Oryzias melastigma]|uniref:B- and T-lymphocyte attenuator n=1 Tax=Oryzias melastigma TaxID=30732 RepID=A0A834CFR1_ORYME|nr:B- and T-lymphocyte attenuator [Oryzias melastigma]